MYVPTHSHWGVNTLYIALFNKYLSGKKRYNNQNVNSENVCGRTVLSTPCFGTEGLHFTLSDHFTAAKLLYLPTKKIKHLGSPLQTLSTHLSRSEWSDMWLLFSLSLVYCTSSRWWLNPPCVFRAHPGTSVMYHITSFNIWKYPELFSDCERIRIPGVSVYYQVRPRGGSCLRLAEGAAIYLAASAQQSPAKQRLCLS